jgi:hypothetical protein
MAADQNNADETVYTLVTQPGIKRDGTLIEGEFCTDGQWVRFQRQKPKKMGGYRRITDGLSGPVRKFILWSRKYLNSAISFHEAGIETLLIDNNFIGNDIRNRTPLSGFTANTNNLWTADTQYDDAVATTGTIVVAHCNQSLFNIDDDTASKPFWALADSSSSIFATITDAPAVSGGVFTIAPYTFAFGSDGFIAWSDANQPQVWDTSAVPGDAGSDRVTGAKIVAGMAVRSGQLAGLLWSLDSVIRMDYVGGQAIWKFSTVSTQSSILAQNSVIEYDGIYFWIGVDRFLYYDSSVKELPNDLNQNWFFDNVNYEHRQKIWATKIPRFGEVWWLYPRGQETECSHAIIFNVRLKTWYDVELPRSAGYYSQVRQFPTMIGSATEEGTPQLIQFQAWARTTTTATVTRLAHDLTSGVSIDISQSTNNVAIPDGVYTISTIVTTSTWARAGTTATFTYADHGYTNGQQIVVTVSSDTLAIPLGIYAITVTTPSAFTIICLNAGAAAGTTTYNTLDVFTFTCVNSGTTSGTLSFDTIDPTYGLYQHEFGHNAVVGDTESAIRSYYTTQNFGYPTGGVQDSPQGPNRWTRLTRVEPDFVQTEDMTVTVIGYEFAQATSEPETSYTFTPNTGKIDMREQRRHIFLKFESNVVDGDYEAGKVLIHTELGDNRS